VLSMASSGACLFQNIFPMARGALVNEKCKAKKVAQETKETTALLPEMFHGD